MSQVLTALLTVFLVQILASTEARALNIAGPTSEWSGIIYPGLTPDPGDDHQTGQPEADIVGDTSFAALFTQYDAGALPSTSDDVLAFRLRLGGEKNPAGYSHVAIVGMDADLDGSIDLFIILNNTGQDSIELYTTGGDTNTSPNTTSTSYAGYTYAETGLNYDWTAVSVVNCPECTSAPDLDLDLDGNNDFFLSFAVPFDDIIAVLALDGITGVTPSTEVSYVIGTSVIPNAYNQDLGGVDGDPDPNSTWSTLGAISTPSGINPVPEPSTALLLSLGLCVIAASRHRRSPA